MKNHILRTFLALFMLLGLSSCNVRLDIPAKDGYAAVATYQVGADDKMGMSVTMEYYKGDVQIGSAVIDNPYAGEDQGLRTGALRDYLIVVTQAFVDEYKKNQSAAVQSTGAQGQIAKDNTAVNHSTLSTINNSTQTIQNVTEQIKIIQPTQVNPCFLGPPHC